MLLSYLDKERVTKSQSTLKVLTEGIIQETKVQQTNLIIKLIGLKYAILYHLKMYARENTQI